MLAKHLLLGVVLLTPLSSASARFPQGALTEPTAPLDARAQSAKMTSQPIPSPTTAIVQPLPAIHHISDNAAQVPCDAKAWSDARLAIDRGLAYLRTSQDKSGGWMVRKAAAGTDQKQPSLAAATAVSALALKAFAQMGHRPATDASALRAVEFVRARMTPTTGEFNPDAEGGLGNYVASAVVSGLSALEDPADLALLERNIEWLKRGQWDQSEGVSPQKDWFGGSGYGKWGRPDLSNTQLMLDALHDAQVSPDDPAVARALVFLTRTQNNKATNTAPWAQAGANDGGFIYTPANGGESFSSDLAGEGRYGEKMPEGAPRSLRSYGSMTYAGFKSLLYAGLTLDDPRVRAAMNWIEQHWTLAENPGLGQQGYFYYMHAMSRALVAANQAKITDSSGASHNWRDELVAALVSRQKPDGSWMNETARWEESESDLCTVYCVLALEEALKPLPGATTAQSPR